MFSKQMQTDYSLSTAVTLIPIGVGWPGVHPLENLYGRARTISGSISLDVYGCSPLTLFPIYLWPKSLRVLRAIGIATGSQRPSRRNKRNVRFFSKNFFICIKIAYTVVTVVIIKNLSQYA